MDCKNENEKKKEYLKGYRDHVRRIRRIEAELKELQEMRGSRGLQIDGMPHGTEQSDLSSYAAQLDDMEQRLREERYQRVIAYKDIANRIKSLKSEHEQDVMFYRYILGYEWWEIAEKMGFSERQVHRYHGKALEHLKI